VNAYQGAPSYLQFPHHSPWHWPTIERQWLEADVRHSHDHRAVIASTPANVITFHGTGFRENPHGLVQHAGDARVLVSTLDLWLLAPDDVEWMPQMDDLDTLATYRQAHGPDVIRIGHAPTNRSLKSTAEFLAACDQLQADGAPIEVVLIEGQPWERALQMKGTCDVFFDQTAYGYGGNAIEAWAMGIPVVCGAPEATLAEYARRFGLLPFVHATPTTIGDALAQLLQPSQRAYWGQIGRQHAERWHSQQAGADRLAAIYASIS
jgi:glycosyltransferase involved in cell wall biosynthesis